MPPKRNEAGPALRSKRRTEFDDGVTVKDVGEGDETVAESNGIGSNGGDMEQPTTRGVGDPGEVGKESASAAATEAVRESSSDNVQPAAACGAGGSGGEGRDPASNSAQSAANVDKLNDEQTAESHSSENQTSEPINVEKTEEGQQDAATPALRTALLKQSRLEYNNLLDFTDDPWGDTIVLLFQEVIRETDALLGDNMASTETIKEDGSGPMADLTPGHVVMMWGSLSPLARDPTPSQEDITVARRFLSSYVDKGIITKLDEKADLAWRLACMEHVSEETVTDVAASVHEVDASLLVNELYVRCFRGAYTCCHNHFIPAVAEEYDEIAAQGEMGLLLLRICNFVRGPRILMKKQVPVDYQKPNGILCSEEILASRDVSSDELLMWLLRNFTVNGVRPYICAPAVYNNLEEPVTEEPDLNTPISYGTKFQGVGLFGTVQARHNSMFREQILGIGPVMAMNGNVRHSLNRSDIQFLPKGEGTVLRIIPTPGFRAFRTAWYRARLPWAALERVLAIQIDRAIVQRGYHSCVLGVKFQNGHWGGKTGAARWSINLDHRLCYANVLFRKVLDAVWVADHSPEILVSENIISQLGLFQVNIVLERLRDVQYNEGAIVSAMAGHPSGSAEEGQSVSFMHWLDNLPPELFPALVKALRKGRVSQYFAMRSAWMNDWWESHEVTYMTFVFASNKIDLGSPLGLGFASTAHRTTVRDKIEGIHPTECLTLIHGLPFECNENLVITESEMSRKEFAQYDRKRGTQSTSSSQQQAPSSSGSTNTKEPRGAKQMGGGLTTGAGGRGQGPHGTEVVQVGFGRGRRVKPSDTNLGKRPTSVLEHVFGDADGSASEAEDQDTLMQDSFNTLQAKSMQGHPSSSGPLGRHGFSQSVEATPERTLVSLFEKTLQNAQDSQERMARETRECNERMAREAREASERSAQASRDFVKELLVRQETIAKEATRERDEREARLLQMISPAFSQKQIAGPAVPWREVHVFSEDEEHELVGSDFLSSEKWDASALPLLCKGYEKDELNNAGNELVYQLVHRGLSVLVGYPVHRGARLKDAVWIPFEELAQLPIAKKEAYVSLRCESSIWKTGLGGWWIIATLITKHSIEAKFLDDGYELFATERLKKLCQSNTLDESAGNDLTPGSSRGPKLH